MMGYRRFLTFCCAVALLMHVGSTALAVDRELVSDGEANSAIVIDTPDNDFARQAANELVYHVTRASGIAIPTIDKDTVSELPDDKTIVVIGGGDLARSLGASVDDLREEEFIVKTQGRHVVFAGCDAIAGSEPGGTSGSPATLWAVDYFLDRHMGVRWLWPGDVGTYVPEAGRVVVPEMDVRYRPEMVTRRFRPALKSRGTIDARTTNRDEVDQTIADVDRWNARHQLGRREAIGSMHSFQEWWEKYHEEYPDIFATLPEGMTHPYPTAERVNLCVSNPQVEELILEEWRAAGRPDMWSVAPNDGQGYCVCEDCRALDIPDTLGADPLDIVFNRSVVSLTGRYLDLWRRLLDRMRAENPDASLKTLAYANYRLANSEMEPLGYEDALTISLVPDNWTEEEYQSLSEWQRLGADVILRPNFWFVGGAAPYLPLHEAGRFWEHAVDTDIIGWYGNMRGYWGTQGPQYYLVTRLCTRPELGVDDVLAEYASAFGESAPAIEEYLSYWEEITEAADYPDWAGHFQEHGGFYERTLTERDLRIHPFWGSWYIMPFLYTDERLAGAHQILDRAAALADGDADALAKIDFLRDGLEHLELTRDVVELANAKLRPEVEGAETLRDQERQFRRLVVRLKNMRAHLNETHVIWADQIAAHEQRRRVKMTDALADPWAASVVPTDAWGQWQFRKDPDDVGRTEKWFAPDADAEAWQPIEVGVFWGDTHVGDYQGYGWYRTTFDMPEDWGHDTVALTFGAVDEQAWVYLDGRPVGEHTIESESTDGKKATIGDLWNVPFTIEVPVEKVKLGEPNALVVRVHNRVGAGGIWGGVYVQPPSDPLFVSTETLPGGVAWEPGVDYTDFRMTRIGSGRADITVDADTEGVIMEAGADGGGWALYIHDGRLYFQCGKGNEFRAENQSVIEVPITTGRHVIEWSADATRSTAIVRIDGEIAAVSEQPIYDYIAGNDPGGIGGIHNVVCRNAAGWYRGETGEFTGTIHSATVWPDMVCF